MHSQILLIRLLTLEENTEDESEDENAALHKKQTAEQMIAGIGEALAALAGST